MTDALGSFSSRLGETERKVAAAPEAGASSNASAGLAESPGVSSSSAIGAREVAVGVMDQLRGPVVADDPALSPKRRLERAAASAEVADRTVSPSKEALRESTDKLASVATAELKLVERIAASDGQELIRRYGYDLAAERIASSAGVDTVGVVVSVLMPRFPPAFEADDEGGAEDIEEESYEGSEPCSEATEEPPEPEVVQYIPSDGSREASRLV